VRVVDYNPNTLKVSPDWKTRVDKLKAKVLAEKDPKKRAQLIKKNSSLWSEIKHELAKVFNFKCWYTESRQIGTDVDVDHYRPKNSVAELSNNVPQHYGYWWLAFELSNYRYSCIIANRQRRDVVTSALGGKADFFPIRDETNRAWDENADLDIEQPMLLDPCKLSDVRLLTFKDDGEAMPRERVDDKPILFNRADISIRLYSLNHTDFVRERIKLRDDLRKLIKNAKKYYQKLETGDAVHEHAYEQTIIKIREAIDKKSEFSSFCLAYLENYKHEEALSGVFL
jgi:hypothetical protein